MSSTSTWVIQSHCYFRWITFSLQFVLCWSWVSSKLDMPGKPPQRAVQEACWSDAQTTSPDIFSGMGAAALLLPYFFHMSEFLTLSLRDKARHPFQLLLSMFIMISYRTLPTIGESWNTEKVVNLSLQLQLPLHPDTQAK